MKTQGFVTLGLLAIASGVMAHVGKSFVDDDATPACKAVQNRIIGANFFDSVGESDAGQCCLACYIVPGCKAWTLDSHSTCFLKNNTVDGGSSTDHISGYFPDGPPPAPKPPPTPVPIPRACTGEYAYLPFCDSSLDIETRIDYVLAELYNNNTDRIPPLLTARASPNNDVPGVLPEYDWGMNAVHGVQSRCGYKNVSVFDVLARPGAAMVDSGETARVYNCPTSFPSPNCFGAAWNYSGWQNMGHVIGWEARSLWLQGVGENHGNNLPHIGLDAWSPNINLGRDPRWGRNQEIVGEDPLMLGQYGKAYTKGIQDGVDPNNIQCVVTLKHWAAYSLEHYGNYTRHNFNAVVSPFMFASTYFPAFKDAVTEGNARGIMCSYNAVNGVPSCADPFLAGVLRDEWGFNGYQTSDSGAVNDVYSQHHYVETSEEAAAVCINNTGGRTDINSGGVYSGSLLSAVSDGLTTWDDVNRALRNHFRIRFWLGLFDHFDSPYWNVPEDVVHTTETEAQSLEASRESMILLKNDKNVLPLPSGKTVAVIGPHGEAQGDLLGNYLGEICPFGQTSCFPSVLDAVTTANAGGKTLYSQGCDVECTDTTGFGAAIATAHQADYVVIFAGINQQIEREGEDRTRIDLPGFQNELIKNVTGAGKPTILVLINGGIVAIDEAEPLVDGIVEAFYPGFNGATAIADVLFGTYNPGGKLPVTLYQNSSIAEFDFYDMDISTAPGRTYRFFTGEPTFPFGHGLSYTTFNLSWSPAPPTPPPSTVDFTLPQLKHHYVARNPTSVTLNTVSGDRVRLARETTKALLEAMDMAHLEQTGRRLPASPTLSSGMVASGAGILEEIIYTITVTNTGNLDGDEVVQGYFVPQNVSAVQPQDASKVPLARQLFAFQRVHVAKGASTTVTFTLDASKLAVAEPETGDIVSAPGDYVIEFTNGVDLLLTSTVTLEGNLQSIDDYVPRKLAEVRN